MLVYMGIADGMVSGAIHSTADTVRPALQIIKTKPGVKSVSGAFIMVRGRDDNEKYIFGDCAINIKPDAPTLADIAVASAETARLFDIDPKIAMLSFSTKGSGKSEDVDKVVEATTLVKEGHPEVEIDGELQFDAALFQLLHVKKHLIQKLLVVQTSLSSQTFNQGILDTKLRNV